MTVIKTIYRLCFQGLFILLVTSLDLNMCTIRDGGTDGQTDRLWWHCTSQPLCLSSLSVCL